MSLHPTEIAVVDDALVIDWQDGARSRIPLVTLRRACGCTACRSGQMMTGGGLPLDLLDSRASRVRALDLVSSSLLRVTWEDGHDRSLYRFSELRRLLPLEHPATDR